MIKNTIVLCISVTIMFSGCKENYVPKPRGYFRIDFPEKTYQKYDSICSYVFEYPEYAVIEPENQDKPCWINISFPKFNAKIHISYIPVKENLGVLLEDTYSLAYKHTQKADAISTIPVSIPEKNVYGLIYQIKGNAASSRQFYLTDSIRHYLRGALYFSEVPNKDSLAPVIDFISKDIDKMIESFHWKY